MTNLQRADPAARRRAILWVAITLLLGTVLILGVERYSEPLREWIVTDPERAPGRLKLVFILFAAGASAPLLAFAAYLWALGRQVIRAGQFPPPGGVVVRDTVRVEGPAARTRGRALKTFAACLAGFCVVFWILLWRLASLLRAAS